MSPAENRDQLSLKDAIWAVQPGWVKALALTVMLPAWLILGFGVLTGKLSESTMNADALIFGTVVAIELVVILRAFWKRYL